MTLTRAGNGDLLLQMKLENLRNNRRTCPESQRRAFDQLIAQTEAELLAADLSDGPSRAPAGRPGRHLAFGDGFMPAF